MENNNSNLYNIDDHYSLIDELPAIVYIQAFDHTIKFKNKHFRSLFGDDSGPCTWIFDGFENGNEENSLQLLENNIPHEWEWDSWDKRTYHIYNYPIIDIDGIPCILGLGIDVTERKKVDEALKILELEKRAILESVSDYIVYMDTEMKVIWANKVACESAGLTQEQITGQKCHDLWFKRGVPFDGCCVNSPIMAGKPEEGEVRSIDGRVWSCKTNPIEDKEGNVIGFIQIAKETTEKKRAEQTINDAMMKLETIIENTPMIPIQGYDINGVIKHWNNASVQLYGYERDEAIGSRLQDLLLSDENKAIFENSLKEIIDTGCPTRQQVWEVIVKNGHSKYVYSSMFPVFENGAISEIFCIDVDITDRKKAEEMLKRSFIELEERINERTDKLKSLNITLLKEARERNKIEKRALYLASFPELNPQPIIEVTVDGSISYLNPSAKKFFPDLEIKGSFHHLIEGYEDIFQELKKGIKPYVRDVVYGDNHYEENISYVPDKNVIRIYIRDITRKKIMEESLKMMQYSIDSSADIIFWIDPDGRIFNTNESATTILGYSKEEFKSLSINDLDSQIDNKMVIEIWQKIKKFGYYKTDTTLNAKDGRKIPVEIVSNYIKYGKKEFCCSFIRDITERIRSEEELRKTSNYLESLINYANAPIIVWDPDFNIIRFNHAFEYLTGYMSNKVIGENLSILFPYGSRDDSLNKIRLTLKGEQWKSVEIPIKTISGDIRIALWNSANIYAEDGTTLLATIAQGQDITERKKAEEELWKTRNYLENLINYANAPIIVWDTDFNIIRFNHAFERLTGYISGEVLNKSLNILFPEDCSDECLDKIGLTLKGEHWESVEIPILCKDGNIRIALWNSANILDDDGNKILATIAQGQDITERKEAEKELSESKARSELYVDLMGHDINNMNQISMGFLELAEEIISIEGKLDKENINLIEKPIEMLKNSSKLIDSVRKLQRERMGLYKPEIFDIGKMLNDVRSRYSSVPGRDISINCNVLPDCKVKANELLWEVFSNLVDNAIKHSRGQLTVNLNMERLADSDKNYIKVMVEDNGPGIPDNLKEKLFDRLSLDSTRVRGKGFGLCLTKMLIDDFNGKFWVENRVKNDHTLGSKFVVVLPLIEKF
jgi:PAS domain S-box-containing protein